jgi:UDP-N-acetylmuramoyl-tripeptide--D-alanyl-D-alanine ligase
MPRLSVKEIIGIVNAQTAKAPGPPGDMAATGYAFDTRKLVAGDLFFALKGENRDGHAYVPDACARGAVAAVVEREVSGLPDDFVQIIVPSPLDALQALATDVRQRFKIPVVAISGSNGKTTTKDMLAVILAGSMRVRKSPGNFNNHIGVPLSILALEETDEVLVVEIGSNHRGEIARLCRIAMPVVGVVTNVGCAHIGHFGSVEAIAQEKTDILRGLAPGGRGVINADDMLIRSAVRDIEADLIGFGTSSEAEFRVTDIRQAGTGISFIIKDVPVALGVLGIHNAYNAAAAVASASIFGVDPPEAAARLASFQPVRMKMTAHEGLTLIDDSYNANPDSVDAALTAACALENPRKIFVMGEMLELGGDAERFHRKIGSRVAALGIDIFVGIGGFTKAAVEAARSSGMKPDRAVFFDQKSQAKEHLRQTLKAGDLVLVKGSRMAGLDEISEYLRREAVKGRT